MVEIGVDLVAANPNLTFIFFIGLAILAVLGLRFAYYAHRNRTETEITAQTRIWSHLLYVGVFATLYALSGLLEIVTSLQLPEKSALLLATTLLLAFAIRHINHVAASAGADEKLWLGERAVRVASVGAVFLLAVVVSVDGTSQLTAAVEGLSATAFLGYGVICVRGQMAAPRLQGTMLDSLLRHLLPVLAFTGLVSVVNLAAAAGLDRIVVLHVQVVFIIMAATALMTATIKLRQNLAGL